MTPDQVSTILVRLEGQDDLLKDIHTQVKTTNGRVTALEIQAAIDKALAAEKAKREAVQTAHRAWVTPMCAGLGATFATIGASVILHYAG